MIYECYTRKDFDSAISSAQDGDTVIVRGVDFDDAVDARSKADVVFDRCYFSGSHIPLSEAREFVRTGQAHWGGA